ncbi:MAG TPA: hypothetical protein VGK32_05070 [Vicinamibacterales bacterium]|jgi:hypothetical protein
MKRSLVLVLVGGIMLSVGCSREQPAPPPSTAAASVPAAAPAPAATPVPAAAAESVAEFPDYPGAVRITSGQRAETEHGFTRKSEASWTSADPYGTVVAYYQKAIADRGWTITATESKAAEIEWRLAKGTSVGKIEVKQTVPVTIKIERSDR